jgi:putative phosphoesterase
MNILAITDIHGRQSFSDKLKSIMSEVDLIVIAGDITDFGDVQDAQTIIENLMLYNENILAVTGNCDHPAINTLLTRMNIDLQTKERAIGNIKFFGLSGSGKTPFSTPQEYTESEFSSSFKKMKKDDNYRYHILVSHAPPLRTKLDRTFLGIHAGSKAVRDFIMAFHPDLVICGHIHEARGTDKIGSTVVLNPGPFPKHYAIIRISEKIAFELC